MTSWQRWYQKNKEARREYMALYRLKNHEKLLEQGRQRRLRDKRRMIEKAYGHNFSISKVA